MTRMPAGEIVPGRDVVQVFTATEDELCAVSPLIATYDRRARGKLHQAMYHASATGRADASGVRGLLHKGLWRTNGWPGREGDEIAQRCDNVAGMLDNHESEFMFGPLAGSKGQTYALRISASDVSVGRGATVYLTDEAARIPGHVACYAGDRLVQGLGVEARVAGAPADVDSPVPEGLMLSPVTQCNLNCAHCISRNTRSEAHRWPASIRDELRAWFLSGHIQSFACDYSGDTLWADARYGGVLDYLFALDVPFQIDTNGVAITRDVARRLIRSRVYSLNVSLDTATVESYRRVRRGAPPLGEVVANTEAFMAEYADAGADFRVSISLTLMRSTLHEWLDFIRLAERLGIRLVLYRHLEVYTDDMDGESLVHDRARYNEVRGQAIELAHAVGIQLNVPPPIPSELGNTGHGLCREPWRSAAVLGNGDVLACCVPGMKMGNLHEQSLHEIWHGEAFRRLRGTVNSADPPDPCTACTYHRRHDNLGAYLFHRAMADRAERIASS